MTDDYKPNRLTKLLIDVFGVVFFLIGYLLLRPHWACAIPAIFMVANIGLFVRDLFSSDYK